MEGQHIKPKEYQCENCSNKMKITAKDDTYIVLECEHCGSIKNVLLGGKK